MDTASIFAEGSGVATREEGAFGQTPPTAVNHFMTYYIMNKEKQKFQSKNIVLPEWKFVLVKC